MTRIADLLDRDLSVPIEETVQVDNDDPETVYRELTEYVATDRIKTEYEGLFSALAEAPKSPDAGVGVWISGFFGSGKSSFAKILGYVLANREILGVSASSLFLKRVESERVNECLRFLNQAVPYEIFMFHFPVDLPEQTDREQIAGCMYQFLLRDLDYAEDHDISELEMELEKEGQLAVFQDLCRAEYKNEWRGIRKGSQRLARASALLHRLDPRTYSSTDTWLHIITARPSRSLSVQDLVKKLFDVCEMRRPGKTFAFIVDELGQYVARGGDRLDSLCAVVEQFGKESRERLKSGKIPGPAWIIVTAQEKLPEVFSRLAASSLDLARLQDQFKYQIHLSSGDIREVVARRVLRKKESRESIPRKQFHDGGASLIQNVKLELCSRPTEFDEHQFVQFYPYLPHLIDLSLDILAGMLLHPSAPIHLGGSNRTIVQQSFEMLVSDQTRLADQPVGVLVSIDKIYELVEANIPWEKQKNILDIRKRFDDEDYPGMAVRVAKAICLMEFVKTGLPRTTKNIAALLIQRITEPPPARAVETVLYRLKAAQLVRLTENGWKLNELDELRRAAAGLEGLRKAVGSINPRPPGWHNDLIQLWKKSLARLMGWYTRSLNEFNASVSQSLEGTASAVDQLFKNMVVLDHLSMNMVAVEELSMNMVALEGRLAQWEKMSATQAESMQKQLAFLHQQVNALVNSQQGSNLELGAGRTETDWDQRAHENYRLHDRTAYIIGLFGTGRRYINDLMLENIGGRAKYFRDMIRLHPGPTPMIYSGHATIRHASRAQELPEVMRRILEGAASGFADLIFVYRHPLDSLLTNWVWWRTYMRDNWAISGISQIYKNLDDVCVDLEENFLEFKAFAEGDPDCFGVAPGPRFLSFAEFVEETELHRQAARLTLRLEDFMIDPLKEFSKIAEVMSVDLDLSRLSIAAPKTKPYRHVAVKEKVPRFRDFINGLDAKTKSRIEKCGYISGQDASDTTA